MPERFDEVTVNKHIKMKSSLGSIDVHSSNSVLGAWLTKDKKSIGIHAQPNGCLAISVYNDRTPLPEVAIRTDGIQFGTTHDDSVFVPWDVVRQKLTQ